MGIVILVLSLQAQSFETIHCEATKAVQYGDANMAAVADLSFELERNGNFSEMKNIKGHIFVKSQYEDGDAITPENSYRGYFQINSLKANSNYNPHKYKEWFQFKDFNASTTDGVEDGMWGSLLLDLSGDDSFDARYIFQAGDHMGGTVILKCRSN
jgi:hypothetical protein